VLQNVVVAGGKWAMDDHRPLRVEWTIWLESFRGAERPFVVPDNPKYSLRMLMMM